MKFKNWPLKEEYLKTGSAIIYHRTSKEALSGIIATGFQAGGGDMYGKGFYATLDLESQNNDYMLNSYGDTLTKWFIPHLNHFVIFNPILANMVHGTSSIEEQLKKIVGENLPQLDANVSNYKISQRTAPSALKFSQDYLQKLNPQQKDKIAGLIFSGENDGNIFVAYRNEEIIFNGFFYAPSIMDSKQLNQLKTGHGWESRVGVERIKDIYQMPNYDKRARLAKELKKDKEFNKDNEKLNLLNSQLINRAENGNLRAVEYLIKKGANDFEEAMSSAAKGGSLDIVKLMIEKGAKDFNSAINYAAEGGHLKIVELMLEKGAYNLSFAIDYAAKGGHLDIVKLLIENGSLSFNYPMISAAQNGHLEIVKLMIEKGATKFSAALLRAAEGGHLEIVKLMIEKGATNFKQAMNYAAQNGHKDIFDYINNLSYQKDNPNLLKPKDQELKKPQDPVRNPWLSRLRSKIGI